MNRAKNKRKERKKKGKTRTSSEMVVERTSVRETRGSLEVRAKTKKGATEQRDEAV